jgi:PIN domain nuclease of toxin-antitoxin system
LAEVIQQVESNEFQVWTVANKHLIHYDQIPYYKDHGDPFDRLILATALAEQVAVISADEKFERYNGLIELTRA